MPRIPLESPDVEWRQTISGSDVVVVVGVALSFHVSSFRQFARITHVIADTIHRLGFFLGFAQNHWYTIIISFFHPHTRFDFLWSFPLLLFTTATGWIKSQRKTFFYSFSILRFHSYHHLLWIEERFDGDDYNEHWNYSTDTHTPLINVQIVPRTHFLFPSFTGILFFLSLFHWGSGSLTDYVIHLILSPLLYMCVDIIPPLIMSGSPQWGCTQFDWWTLNPPLDIVSSWPINIVATNLFAHCTRTGGIYNWICAENDY